MGLFDIFKKKKEEPIQNSLNSVFTLRFAVPYFSVFDKTNPKLRSFPVKIACGGSVQYRIADPDLCFDNIPLGSMTAEQLEGHVKDSLVASVKHFISSIDYLPLLQFESELIRINDAAKEYLIPQFADEYGINLRTFTLSRLSYDEEDPNYQRLFAQSAALADKMGEHDLQNMEMDHEDETYEREHQRKIRRFKDDDELQTLKMNQEDDQYEREHQRRVRKLQDDELLSEREDNLRLRRQSSEYAMRRNEHRLNNEMESDDIDILRKRRELEEDMHARRTATNSGAKLSESLGKRQTPGLGQNKTPNLKGEKSEEEELDLGSL